jgi:hypothetical protein
MLLSITIGIVMNISDRIARRIRAKRRGWVFSPRDFLDIAPRGAVDNILSRLAKKGLIRRIDKGIYDFPKVIHNIGMLSPSSDDIASVLVRKTGDKVFPSGAAAANLLGLSTQVPARPTYLTSGASKCKKIGNRTIMLKHARVPLIDNISFEANLALQALFYMGKDNVDDKLIQTCAKKLSKSDVVSLSKAAPLIPVWMVPIVHKLQSISDNG